MSQDQTTPVNEAENAAAQDAAQEAPAEAAPEVNAPVSPEVSALLAKIEEYKEAWQRERADFMNYKRRAEREQSEARGRGAQDAVMKLLPVMDDFERVIQVVPAELSGNSWFEGIELLFSKLDRVLADVQVEKIDPTGQPFDPNMHEAVGVDEPTDEVPSGHVTATLRKGYVSGSRVLRPAIVRVAQ